MRVIFKQPGSDCHQMIIPNDKQLFQQLLGGPVEAFPLKDDTIVICNEHRKLLDLEENFKIEHLNDTITGPVIFAGFEDDKLTDINPLVARFIRFALNENGRI